MLTNLLRNEIKNMIIIEANEIPIEVFEWYADNSKGVISQTIKQLGITKTILDDVEDFNTNSLNALLKIIEEPGEYNYFILINNQSRPLLETIKSRCIDIKFILKKTDRDTIIASLLDFFKQKLVLNDETIQISPGNFLKYNWFFK